MYRTYGAAKRNANGRPVIEVCGVYLVNPDGFHPYLSVSLIDGKGIITGTITLSHLDRLGNANHARTRVPIDRCAFDSTRTLVEYEQRAIKREKEINV